MDMAMLGRGLLLALLALPLGAAAQLEPGRTVGQFAVPDSPVFASLGGVVLTQADLDAYIQQHIPEEHRAAVLRDPKRIADLVERQLLLRLLANEALANNLDQEPATAAVLYQQAIGELARREVQRYVDANRLDSYQVQAEELALLEPDLVESEHTLTFDQFLVSGRNDDSRLTTAARAAELYRRYANNEISFDELVARHSEDPALDENQGRYENIDPARLDDIVAAELAELAPGEISEPFETRFGWHVVRLVSRNETELTEDERMARYRELAQQRHLASLRTGYMRTLLHQPFEIAPGAVRELMARYGVELDDEKAYGEQLAPADSQAKSTGDNDR